MKSIYKFPLILIFYTVLLVGCGNNSTYQKQKQATPDKTNKTIDTTKTDENTVNTPNTTTPIKSDAELQNTYTTRFGEINLITYPTFSFDYPDDWTITSEEVTPYSEKVILANNTGVSITYWNFGEMRDLTGPTRGINYIDVTKMANSSFVPGYVQATDYSDLGKFMVAKLETTGYCDMELGEDVALENSRVRYALLPESQIGEQTETVIVGLPTFSFWYAGHISLIADSPNGNFTEQEEKEIISIIASFREEYISDEELNVASNFTGSNTAASIEELWSILKGEWVFEEYIYIYIWKRAWSMLTIH